MSDTFGFRGSPTAIHEPGTALGLPALDTTAERKPSPTVGSTFPRTGQGEGFVPTGLVGELATFIYDNSPYPNWNIAIAGSLALLSTLFGRVFNFSESGLNVWIGIVGETAIGKEAAQSGISKIVSAVHKTCPCVIDFVGPSKWASGEAIHKRLARTPAVLGFVGELGIKMKTWCGVKAPPVHAAMIGFMLDTFGKSGAGSVLQGQENSDREKGAAAIERPCLVLLGDTTLTTLNEALDESLLANGFLPRWTFIFAGDKRGTLNKRRAGVPSSDLVEQVANAAVHAIGKTVTDIAIEADAEAEADAVEVFSTTKIEGSCAEITRHLYSRAYLNIMKIAAICAIGRARYSFPTICLQDILWAKHIVFAGIDQVLAQFDSGHVGEQAGNQAKQEREVRRVIAEYCTRPWTDKYHGLREMHADYIITKAHIQQRLTATAAFRDDRIGAKAAIERAIISLTDADIIRRIPNAQIVERFNKQCVAYQPSDPDAIMRSL